MRRKEQPPSNKSKGSQSPSKRSSNIFNNIFNSGKGRSSKGRPNDRRAPRVVRSWQRQLEEQELAFKMWTMRYVAPAAALGAVVSGLWIRHGACMLISPMLHTSFTAMRAAWGTPLTPPTPRATMHLALSLQARWPQAKLVPCAALVCACTGRGVALVSMCVCVRTGAGGNDCMGAHDRAA